MFAIVEFAGKQVKVSQDQIIEVPKLDGNVGDVIESDKVLMMSKANNLQLGTPYVSAAYVKATIYAHDRTKKTIASIYKRRKQYKRTWGFRRDFTLLKITELST